MSYLVSQCLNGLSVGCIYALIALGFAMVYGVLKLLNFAHSEVFMSGTFLAYFTLRALAGRPGVPAAAAVVAAVAVAGLGSGVLALLLERVAYRPLRSEPKVAALLSAIGMSVLLQQVGLHAFGAATRGFPQVDLGVSPRAFALGVLTVSFVVLRLLVYRTEAGVRMRAVADDPGMVELLGLDPTRYVRFAFFLGGFCAGLAGVTWGLVYGTVHPQMGFQPGIKSFIIAVVGGDGRLDGTFLAGVTYGLAEVLLAAYLPPELSGYRDAVLYMILLAALCARPAGLLGVGGPPKV